MFAKTDCYKNVAIALLHAWCIYWPFSSVGVQIISPKQGFKIFILTGSPFMKHISNIQAKSMTWASHFRYCLPYSHIVYIIFPLVHLRLYTVRITLIIEMISPLRYFLYDGLKRKLCIEEHLLLIVPISFNNHLVNSWQMVDSFKLLR